MGLVEIDGKVDVFQYWPNGGSDVDTLKFVPDFPSARYHGDGGSADVAAFFQKGGMFLPDDDKPGQEKFRSIVRKGGGLSLSIRLQGIDAPELHYAPNFREGMFDGDFSRWIARHLSRQKSYRQPYGKLCADFFGKGVRRQLGLETIDEDAPERLVDAKLTIHADGINQAVDVFGRVVGYVALRTAHGEVLLNDYALSEGFAFCSFYGSMRIDEMNRLSALFAAHGTGGTPKSQLRGNFSRQLRDFEPDLWTTKSMRDTDRDDNGADAFRSKCFDPKLFRRCVDWVGRREALGETVPLLDYMRSNNENVATLEDFIDAGGDWLAARKIAMGSLVEETGAFSRLPGEVVFEARPVTVVDEARQPLPTSFLSPFA